MHFLPCAIIQTDCYCAGLGLILRYSVCGVSELALSWSRERRSEESVRWERLTLCHSPNVNWIIQIEDEIEGALARLGKIEIHNFDRQIGRKEATSKA